MILFFECLGTIRQQLGAQPAPDSSSASLAWPCMGPHLWNGDSKGATSKVSGPEGSMS